jgi:hypothetical protein
MYKNISDKTSALILSDLDNREPDRLLAVRTARPRFRPEFTCALAKTDFIGFIPFVCWQRHVNLGKPADHISNELTEQDFLNFYLEWMKANLSWQRQVKEL